MRFAGWRWPFLRADWAGLGGRRLRLRVARACRWPPRSSRGERDLLQSPGPLVPPGTDWPVSWACTWGRQTPRPQGSRLVKDSVLPHLDTAALHPESLRGSPSPTGMKREGRPAFTGHLLYTAGTPLGTINISMPQMRKQAACGGWRRAEMPTQRHALSFGPVLTC